MSKKGGAALQKDAPWRQSSGKPIPKIHHSPIVRLPNTPYSNYALSISQVPVIFKAFITYLLYASI